MRKTAAVLCLALLPVITSGSQSETIEKRVVVIFGNTDVGVWEQQYSHSLHQALNIGARVKVSLEFIGLNFADTSELPLLAESVRLRHSSLPADLVMAVQPSANTFLEEWGHVFAQDLPKLFVLPGRTTLERISGNDRASVLRSGWDDAVLGTFRLVPRLLPGTTNLYVVSGDGVSDLSYLERARKVLSEESSAAQVHYLVGYPPDELLQALAAAPPNSAVLVLSYVHSKSGANYRTADIVQLLDAQSGLPVFAPFDSVLNYGIVGGDMTSADKYGRESARVALEILRDPESTISTSLPTRVAFDASKLAHWNISRRHLPEDSEIVNEPPSAWDEYGAQIVMIILVIAFQLLIIVALFNAWRTRRIAERERASQVRLFEAVINSIHDAVLITDVDRNVIASNAGGLEETFGYQSGEVFNKKLDELVVVPEVLTVPHKEPVSIELLDVRGQRFPGELVNAPIIDSEGEHRGHFAIVRNVSERLKKEDELRHAHKMEALGNLAGGIAHDFNNLLTAILGNTEIAQMRAKGQEPVQQSLAKVMSAGERAADLVRQILTFSRRADEQILTPLNLTDVLQQSIGFLEASIPSRIRINVSIAEDLWNVSANETEIHQIILNLANNSAHSIKGNGQLSFSLRNRVIDASTQLYKCILPPGKYVLLSVSDTGEGIAPDILDRVTEPFFTTKDAGEGTGMGLALVFGIAEHHDALLDLHSEVGSGTTIDLYFPARGQRTSLEPAKDQDPPPRGDGQLIMIVDDENIVLETCERELNLLGYNTESFTNPKEALARFTQDPDIFDLVISDMTMPMMDGLSLLSSIKKVRSEIPVVLCTGYNDVRNSSRDSGNVIEIFAELSKPYRISEVAKVLTSALA